MAKPGTKTTLVLVILSILILIGSYIMYLHNPPKPFIEKSISDEFHKKINQK